MAIEMLPERLPCCIESGKYFCPQHIQQHEAKQLFAKVLRSKRAFETAAARGGMSAQDIAETWAA